MRRLVQGLLLVALVGLGGVTGYRAWDRFERFRDVERVCRAAQGGRWETAAALGADLVGPDVAGRRVAECRCVALMELGRRRECTTSLEGLLADPRTGEWIPFPILTAVLVESRRDEGRLPEAAQLAHEGARRYPESSVLFYLELVLRSQVEEEGEVLRELRRRLDDRELDPRVEAVNRKNLARALLRREDWSEALAVIGDESPDPAVRDQWFNLRMTAFAGAGRVEELRAEADEWRDSGGDPWDVRAYYAYLLSMYHLEDPERRSRTDLLRKVVENAEEIADREFLHTIWVRLVGTLAVSGLHEEALAYFDRGVERFGELDPLRREEIQRSATRAILGEDRLLQARGEIRFLVDETRPGDVLLVSPDPNDPRDAPYEAIPVPSEGVVGVSRSLGVAPQRWVLRDGAGAVRGSGVVWPVPDRAVEAPVQRRGPARSLPAPGSVSDPPDGDRRLVVVVLDCGDWRLLQYLRARGEVPVMDALLDEGWRSVLTSDPPFTAAAIQSLVTPAEQGVASFFDAVHRLGVEVEALNFVGRNPVGLLEWVLPEREDVFETLGAGDLVTVNMLHAYGPLQVGRHGQIVGPGGKRSELSGFRSARSLEESEEDLVPGLGDGQYRDLVREMAADFDALAHVVGTTESDLVVIRVASLDLVTHGLYPDTVVSGQHDGEPLLLQIYRYVDRRLGEVRRLMDGDDVLVVMSDHGIRTAMEHDPKAIFVASGPGVPSGRAPGSPALRGVGRMMAEFFGVEVDWPSSGLEEWVGGYRNSFKNTR